LTNSYTLYVPPGAAAADYASVVGTFKTPNHDNLLTLRLDDDLTANQQIFVRYAQEWNLVSGNGCGGSTTIGCYDGQIPRHAIVVGHTWEPTARIVNESRFQYAYISYELGPYGTPLPKKPSDLVSPSYLANIGTAYQFLSFGYGHNYAAVGVESRWELNDSLTIQKGAHSFKMGFDVSYVPYVDGLASNANGTFTFKNDQPFNPTNTSNLTNPYSFTQFAIPTIYYLPSTQEAFYFEDNWKARKNLTVNAGLRYERQLGSPFLDTYTPNPAKPTIPYEGNPHDRGDKNNFSPRIGISWDPKGTGKDVIRAGYGVYYNFIETELSEAEKLNFVACNVSLVTGSPAGYQVPYPNPYGGGTATNFCSSAPPTVVILGPGLSNPYQHQFSLGYSRQLGSDLSFSADGIYTRGLRDYKVYDRNYPLLNGAPSISGARPYSNFTQIQQHDSTGASEYKGLYLKLEKRMSHRYMYTLSYALSSALDNNPHSAPVSYAAPGNDWGPAAIDQRHAIVASGSALLRWGFVVGGIFSFRSSLPFNPTTTTTNSVLPASTLNANGTAQYVPGTTRDQGNRGLSFTALNAYRTAFNATCSPQATCQLSTNLSASSVASTNYLDFDLRVSKFIFQRGTKRLEIIGQAFNLFGRQNYTTIQTAPTSPTFGAPTAANTVQIGELAARFSF
jgi:TonB dependent receptor